MRDQSLTPERALYMQQQQEKRLPFIWKKPWAGPTKFIDKLSKKAASLKREKSKLQALVAMNWALFGTAVYTFISIFTTDYQLV